MKRREFIAGISAAASPLAARAQQRIRVVGGLLGTPEGRLTNVPAFVQGLREEGFVGGENVAFENRYALGPLDRLPGLAAIRWRRSGLKWSGAQYSTARRQHDRFRELGRRIAGGQVAGAVQGGRAALDQGRRYLFSSKVINANALLRASIAAAAAQYGVTIIRMPVQNEVEIEHATTALAAEPDGGLLLTGANAGIISGEIGRLALYHHLPLMWGGAARGEGFEGFLMSHGPDVLDLLRRACSYVDRILRGAKPSELPVQYPTKFELVVNLKTAKAIGVTIPEAFLARADQVIE